MPRKQASLEDIFHAAVDAMLRKHPRDVQGRMLSAPSLVTSGKGYAFLAKGGIGVKLPAERVATLVAERKGVQLGASRGRPMREWICLTSVDASICEALVAESRAFVLAGIAKAQERPDSQASRSRARPSSRKKR